MIGTQYRMPADLAIRAFVDGLATRAVDVQLAVRADGRRWFPLSGLRGDPDVGEEYDLATHPFTLEATGEGIVGWRYKEKK